MARLYRVATLCAALATVAAAAPAAEAPAPGPAAHARRARHTETVVEQVARLTAVLALDAAQQERLSESLRRQQSRIERLWHDPSLSPEAKAQQAEALREATADQIRGFLTEEQREKYAHTVEGRIHEPPPGTART